MKLLFILALLLTPFTADAVWFNSSWQYRVPVSISPSQVGTTSAVTNFPVYVDLTGFPSGFWSNIKPDGGDIRVVESDEVTETAFEIVSLATTSFRGELHFLADSLSTTSTSTFYIYFGNPSASAYAVTDTFGRNNVWTNYLGVWHFQDNGTSSSGTYDLTNNNVTYTDGQIYRAGLWNSSTDNMTNANTIFDFTRNDDFSVSLWIDPVATSTNQFFVNNQQNSGDFIGWTVNHASDGIAEFVMSADLSPIVLLQARTNTGVIDGTDQLLTFTKSTSSDISGLRVYSNGVSRTLNTIFNTLTANPVYTTDLTVGNRGNSSNLNSDISELRISGNELSPAYIRTQFNNQSATSSFYTVGGVEQDEIPVFPTTVMQSGVFSSGIIR